jgi:hypothetical protein
LPRGRIAGQPDAARRPATEGDNIMHKLKGKAAITVALAGALALSSATPSFARHWRGLAAAGIGFGAAAVLGAAAASSAPGYYYGYPSAHAFAPSYYAYEPSYYAYEPGYVNAHPYYYRRGHCPVQGAYRLDYGLC